MFAGLSAHHVIQQRLAYLLPLLLGIGLAFYGLTRLWSQDQRTRRIHSYDAGFIYEVGDRRVHLAFADVDRATVFAETVRLRLFPIGTVCTLLLSYRGKLLALTSFEPVDPAKPGETRTFSSWALDLTHRIEHGSVVPPDKNV